MMTVHELPPPTVVWLTKKQAAARANLSSATIDRARYAGELEYSGGGSSGYAVRIRVDKLDEWLERRGDCEPTDDRGDDDGEATDGG